jgi:hypothetical protein
MNGERLVANLTKGSEARGLLSLGFTLASAGREVDFEIYGGIGSASNSTKLNGFSLPGPNRGRYFSRSFSFCRIMRRLLLMFSKIP